MADSYTASECIACFETTIHNEMFWKSNEISVKMYAEAKKQVRVRSFNFYQQESKELDMSILHITKLKSFLDDKGFVSEFSIGEKASDDGYYLLSVTVSF